MSTGFFDGGGSGMSGSPGLGMMSSTVIWPFLKEIVSDSVIVCVVMLAMMVFEARLLRWFVLSNCRYIINRVEISSRIRQVT